MINEKTANLLLTVAEQLSTMADQLEPILTDDPECAAAVRKASTLIKSSVPPFFQGKKMLADNDPKPALVLVPAARSEDS